MSVTGATTVSVVIVAHNNWPELELAVQSALHQSHPPLEVIVVDNGSTDDTVVHLVRIFGSRIRLIQQENRLDAGGYNSGIRASAGTFIQLLDGDDCLAPNKLEKQLQVFEMDGTCDIVYCDARSYQSAPGVATVFDRPVREYPDMLAALCKHGGNIPGLIPSTALFRRSTFERVGMFDEKIFSADYDFWFRAASQGIRFRLAPEVLVFLRQSPTQMSRKRAAMLQRQDQTLEKALTYIHDDRLRPYLLRHLARGRLLAATDARVGLDGRTARTQLEAARRTSPRDVPLPLYLAARLALSVPGGRHVLTAARRFARELLS